MFGDDEYTVETNDEDSLVEILYKDSDQALLLIHNHTFFQKGSIKPNWILLDMGSSIDVFCNPILLKNIHRSDKMKNIHFNAGVVNITHKGTLHGYRLV